MRNVISGQLIWADVIMSISEWLLSFVFVYHQPKHCGMPGLVVVIIGNGKEHSGT